MYTFNYYQILLTFKENQVHTGVPSRTDPSASSKGDITSKHVVNVAVHETFWFEGLCIGILALITADTICVDLDLLMKDF